MPDIDDKTSLMFRVMAEKIEHNQGSAFGGAIVILPPAQGGDPVAYLSLDEAGDPVLFWSTVRTQVEQALEKLTKNSVVAQTFGRR